jgi:hypothetical protein
MRPILTRDENGSIVKHWTLEAAEAADAERRKRYDEQIRALLTARRRSRLAALIEAARRLFRRTRRPI